MKKKDYTKGFTIVEMLVSVGVFVVVITTLMTAFLNINDLQKRAENLRTVNDNISFSAETMMREIRAGSNYQVSPDGTTLTITNVLGGNTTYRLNNERIEVSTGGAPYLNLTAPEIKITKLYFLVRGQAVGDNLQPMVTIIIKGLAGETARVEKILNIQTTVSQRKMDS
jgi:type II secretory pathway pseudopilin PulG